MSTQSHTRCDTSEAPHMARISGRFIMPQTTTMKLQVLLCTLALLILQRRPDCVSAVSRNGDNDDACDASSARPNPYKTIRDEASAYSRTFASTASRPTQPKQSDVVQPRRTYPETNPHICLAFLSCCGRTDLLNHTIAGAIRHMEEDEPTSADGLRYEIAWVDNGSGADKTQSIVDSYQIEHALTLRENHGLAYGMNLLIFDLCTAPYILLLEEDWLYLDDIVAIQTPQRKRIISTSVALLETLRKEGRTAFDGRDIMGIFLRLESYESFLHFPFADVWEEQEVDLANSLPSLPGTGSCAAGSCDDDAKTKGSGSSMKTSVDYRVFCADTSLGTKNVWGSYTNGAGLYRRQNLMDIGRMYGEPGDPFHDRYVEGNYAYRAALHNCHATIRVTDDKSCSRADNKDCVGAFHHIGGGRSTRPMTAEGTQCEGETWNFFDTPMFDKYNKVSAQMGQPIHLCSPHELKALKERKFRETDSQAYRDEVARLNREVFERERQERDKIRTQAAFIRELLRIDGAQLRVKVTWMASMSDEEILQAAHRMERLADSAHPIPGFWDSHGRIIGGASGNR